MDIPGNLFTCINLSTPTTIRRSCITMLYTPKSQCESKNSNQVNACLHIMSERKPTPTDIPGEDYFSSMLQVWDGDTIELWHIFSKEVASLCNILTLLYYRHHWNIRWTTAFSVQSDCNKLGQAESNLVIVAHARTRTFNLTELWLALRDAVHTLPNSLLRLFTRHRCLRLTVTIPSSTSNMSSAQSPTPQTESSRPKQNTLYANSMYFCFLNDGLWTYQAGFL